MISDYSRSMGIIGNKKVYFSDLMDTKMFFPVAPLTPVNQTDIYGWTASDGIH